MIDSGIFVEASGEVPQGEKILYSGADPESYITEYTIIYKDKTLLHRARAQRARLLE